MIRLFHLACLVGLTLVLFGSPTTGEDLTPDDYTQFWEPVVGNWNMTSTALGKTTTGTFDFQIAPNKKCILLYSGGDGLPFTQQLQGYDPVSKKQVAFGFCQDGHFQIQTISVDGMRKGLKAAKGVGGDWELKTFSTDGKTSVLTCKWKWDALEKDRIVMVWYDAKRDGQPVTEDIRLILERKK